MRRLVLTKMFFFIYMELSFSFYISAVNKSLKKVIFICLNGIKMDIISKYKHIAFCLKNQLSKMGKTRLGEYF